MPKYQVRGVVNYEGEVEADSEPDAYEMGWSFEELLHYDSVEDIVVVELED